MSDLMLDVDQAGELKAAFRRGDWTNAEIKKACEGDLLARFRNVVRGYAEITQIQHVVDCDAKPFVPNGWKVADHRKGGRQFVLDLSKVRLHLSPNQVAGRVIGGHDLRKELASEPVLNANVLDYLLTHPELIPEDWKKDDKGNIRYIFFWGTIYRDSNDNLCVRYLCFSGGTGDWGNDWLDSDWDGDSPAAVSQAQSSELSS